MGKVFDLRTRTIGNTRGTLLNMLARTLLVPHAPMFPKRVDVLCGHFLWALRPLRGATVLLRPWYMHKWHGPRFVPFPSLAMTVALMDLTVLACSPWRALERPIPPPLLTPVICGDAARVHGRFLLALFSPIFGGRLRLAPVDVSSQQEAEFLVFTEATKLATRLGWTTFTYIGDNLGTCWLAVHLRPTLSNRVLSNAVRTLLNRCLWSRLVVHILHCPSEL